MQVADLKLIRSETARFLDRLDTAIISVDPDEELVTRGYKDVRWTWERIKDKNADRIPFQPFVNGLVDEVQS